METEEWEKKRGDKETRVMKSERRKIEGKGLRIGKNKRNMIGRKRKQKSWKEDMKREKKREEKPSNE